MLLEYTNKERFKKYYNIYSNKLVALSLNVTKGWIFSTLEK